MNAASTVNPGPPIKRQHNIDPDLVDEDEEYDQVDLDEEEAMRRHKEKMKYHKQDNLAEAGK